MPTSPAQHSSHGWRIRLFGGLSLQFGDRSLAKFQTRRAASLLACLAFYRHKRHAREELIEMLWPDEDPEATRLRFRQVLTSLRKSFSRLDASGETLLQADRNLVSLDADRVTTDVAEFETVWKQAARQESVQARVEALQQAVGLYTGELLPGHYEEWVSGERRRLTETYLSVLSALAKALAEQGEYSAAFDYIRKALLLDPLREESHEELIRIYAVTGRVADALRQYRELEQTLWKELRTLPSASSQALIEQVRAGTFVESSPGLSVTTVLPAESTALHLSQQEPGDGQNHSAAASPREETPGGLSHSPPVFSPSLAAPLTPFFGREIELAWLATHLQPVREESVQGDRTFPEGRITETRLITLTGLGGSGKTRLALEVARYLQPVYSGAVWFVPLADKDAGDLIVALAGAVCGAGSSAGNLLQQAILALAHRPSLLVLDNFEQMITNGSLAVRALLERVPTLKCLITSRQRLDIEGEQEYPLSPLPLPAPYETPDHLLEYAGIQLFVDRAQRVRPGFLLETEIAEPIAGICAQLEGIPLALELAAAWMALLSPAQMRERLEQRFDLLVSRRQDIPERHRSMRATLEWSYRNLEPDLQRFFARLAIFHGGWTLEAAEAVCDAPQALDYLAQLQQRSLVQAEETAVGMRFGMLELLREFAAEQLSSEEILELRLRHQVYFLDLAERAAPHLIGADQREWLLRLKGDYDNLRFLLAASEAPQGNPKIGLRLFVALWRFWDVYRHYGEAQSWIQRLSEKLVGIDPAWRARILEAGGCLAMNLGYSQKALEMLEESLSLYQAQGDRKGVACSCCCMGIAVRDLGDYHRAHRLFEESSPVLQEMGEPFLVGRAVTGMAVLLGKEGDYTAAFPLMEQGAAMFRICGHKKGLAFCLNGQGNLALDQGDLEAARTFLERALATARDIEDAETMLYSLYRLTNIHYEQGDAAAAEAHLREALSVSIATGAKEWEALFLIWLGALAGDRADYLAAQAYFRDALRICEVGELMLYMAAAIKRIAALEARRGHAESALRLLSAASERNLEEHYHLEPLRLLPQIDVESLRQILGSEVFEQLWAQGRTQSWERVIREAKEAVTM